MLRERRSSPGQAGPAIDHQKGGGVKKTTASELTLITGIGRVPLTRSQVAMWRQRVSAGQRRELRTTVR
jgi:hypothetical protein